MISFEALETGRDGFSDVLWLISDLAATLRGDVIAKLGGEEDLKGSQSVGISSHTGFPHRLYLFTSSRLPVRSNHFPSNCSLSPYRAAESQCVQPSS